MASEADGNDFGPTKEGELTQPEVGFVVFDGREVCWSENEAVALAKTMDGYDEGHVHCIALDFIAPAAPPLTRNKPEDPSDE